MENIVLYPILAQFATSIILMFLWRNVKLQKVVSVAASFVILGIAIWLFWTVYNQGFQSVQSGKWEAPFGITFVADTLSATLVLLTAIAGLAVSAYSTATIIFARLRFGFLPIFHFLLLGLNGAFLTGDIFNLYVWFEIIIISSFVLLTLGGEKAQLEGAVKYFTLNILASVFFLTALAVLYGITGTLNMADLHAKMAAVENRGLVQITALLFLIGFGTKAAIFPFYFWLPASYHTPPDAVSAIFGGLLTKVGVYALIRVFTLIFIGETFISEVIMGLSVLTLLIGGMGALVQNNIVKVFAYLIICHIGFMLLGIGIGGEKALSGVVYYLIHDITVKTNLFLIAGLIYKISGTHSMRNLGNIYKQYPKLSLLIIISLFSVVGIPPFSGFWPKISLINASFGLEGYQGIVMIAAIIFASFITLVVVAKLWARVFWKDALELPNLKNYTYFNDLIFEKKMEIVVPIIFLTIISVYIGFGAENIQRLSQKIAYELMSNTEYINTVLKLK
ncbi:proton-conducting transporter transmembrane domain-containing protein [Capnocytophaga canimorsus]|uniref:proton-conducting transporter transmembrane domain-containing protein n=1 Tax=Capnocytophaga canimorsus TaxID=28188 RepID=UPI0037D0E182